MTTTTTNPEEGSSTTHLNLNSPSITTALASDPSQSPYRLTKKLFPRPSLPKRIWLRFRIKDDLYHRVEPSAEQIQLAYQSGRWSTQSGTTNRPSDLFLKMFSDVLLCLERNQLAGVVSPSLIATCGIIPLTILSVIPDIMQHYYDCIVLAKHEVLIATNYLQISNSQNTLCEALIELSKRVGDRQQKDKVVVKLIYDRGDWKQVFKNHLSIKPNSSPWKEVGLPDLEKIPNLELEVINFHRVLLGTFHSKFLIVDRSVALLNSNNIQDRPNLEMMIHLEGRIVDSFYDMFLISWNNRLNPPLPLIGETPSSQPHTYRFASNNAFLRNIDVVKSAQDARATLHREAETDRNASAHQHQDGLLNSTFSNVVRDLMEDRRRSHHQHNLDPSHSHPDESSRLGPSLPPSVRFSNAVQRLIEEQRRLKNTTTHQVLPKIRASFVGTSHPQNRPKDFASPSTVIESIDEHTTTMSTVASKITADSQITSTEHPSSYEGARQSQSTLSKPPLSDSHAVHNDLNSRHIRVHSDGSTLTTGAANIELAETSSSPSSRRRSVRFSPGKIHISALSDVLNVGTLRQADANVSPDHDIGDFQPHMIHEEHAEFPIVMVNRPPHGLPGHNDIRVPQNAAWMAGFKYAKKKVFIQTPTLNSAPVVKMCVDTAKRGVSVILYLDLGFNDKGESIPFQGGTNQEVVIKMYKTLKKFNCQKNLLVYWYTGKDQIRPINAVLKSRNCHVKFMAVDDSVGIQGNGNQDTQSWFHSQEINVMIDSPQIVQDWMKCLIANQNTQLYGQVNSDGIWRDAEGHTVDYYDQPKLMKNKKLAEGLIKKADPPTQFSTSMPPSPETRQINPEPVTTSIITSPGGTTKIRTTASVGSTNEASGSQPPSPVLTSS
ncbi:hypothetical protein PGT21_028799 [Puccinia graminis f. sp. tritici]|uniref:PLD phosphodiesterase domain-containing protein n=2 Tax=Puccinia graminis f. sp. tritici TaxID=56615 RepID=E3JSQ0_PUCGT|nr:uncharacterized protein PGTG_01668 [Puccinia graminis f. sp. tritici CRL 75-36-700-3]EFP75075.2 hypothetical protein PGTG_01668 [Puccinia graminis f. sp. tritici CRL 75-36-700-3]KAA1117970.1 hypothetical protein PGT21_028799 [Puccinia graminis f. sp. tritici]